MNRKDVRPGPIPCSYWLIEEKLLAGEYPGTYIEADTREKLAKFLSGPLQGLTTPALRSPLVVSRHILMGETHVPVRPLMLTHLLDDRDLESFKQWEGRLRLAEDGMIAFAGDLDEIKSIRAEGCC